MIQKHFLMITDVLMDGEKLNKTRRVSMSGKRGGQVPLCRSGIPNLMASAIRILPFVPSFQFLLVHESMAFVHFPLLQLLHHILLPASFINSVAPELDMPPMSHG